jgi:hypothetical protein
VADLDVQISVARPGGALLLEQDDAFEVIGVGVGGRTWRRRTVEGVYMHGRRLLSAVLNTQTLTVLVRVRGGSWVQVGNHTQTLFEAFSQHAFQVTVTVEGRTDTYQCEPADITPLAGDTIGKFHAMANMQEYQVTIPIQPVGVA